MKFTNGPWKLFHIAYVTCEWSNKEDIQTAKLITAAPELYAALFALLAMHDDAVFVCGSDDEREVDHALSDARTHCATVNSLACTST